MTGIINNMLYIGVIVWNRQTWHVDVDTEKRRSTPLPREEWIYNDAPHLQIVTDDLCARVRARQGEFVDRGPVRRRTRPLAGLLLCGLCGSPMSVLGRDRYGFPTHKELGDEHCSNQRTAAAADIETHALGVLRDSLLAPHLVSLFQRTFTRELKALRSSEVDAEAAARKELASAEAELRQLVEALGKGSDRRARRRSHSDGNGRRQDRDPPLGASGTCVQRQRRRLRAAARPPGARAGGALAEADAGPGNRSQHARCPRRASRRRSSDTGREAWRVFPGVPSARGLICQFIPAPPFVPGAGRWWPTPRG